MAFNTNQVVLDGFTQNDHVFTMYGSGDITIDDVGKAVSLDTSADATVKLAEDGEAIYGRVFQVEDRSQEGVVTVSVETRFRKRVRKESATVINRGDTVVGAGNGFVKAAAAADSAKNTVLAVADDYVIVQQ